MCINFIALTKMCLLFKWFCGLLNWWLCRDSRCSNLLHIEWRKTGTVSDYRTSCKSNVHVSRTVYACWWKAHNKSSSCVGVRWKLMLSVEQNLPFLLGWLRMQRLVWQFTARAEASFVSGPLLGTPFVCAIFSLWCRCMATLLEAGVYSVGGAL